MKTKTITLLLALTILALASFASAQNLTYDTTKNTASFSYDGKDRVLNKTTSTETIIYSYDGLLNDTLTNVTTSNVTIRYEYDSRNRITKEIKVIDGYSFEKDYEYDSMDRPTSLSGSLDYISYSYGDSGKLTKILNIVNISYNEMLQPLSRAFENSLTTNFTRDVNFRLTEIVTGSIQEIKYVYDAKGNILEINDNVTDEHFRMWYDELNRLVKTRIIREGTLNALTYAYNSLGNISNPYTISLNEDQCRNVTWNVNASGENGTWYTFFTFANITSDMSKGDISSLINITIE